jgi:hypothetical protein
MGRTAAGSSAAAAGAAAAGAADAAGMAISWMFSFDCHPYLSTLGREDMTDRNAP